MLENEEQTSRLPDSLKSAAIVRVVCDGFGWPVAGAGATVIGRGAMGRVWKLTTADRAYAIKEMLWGEAWGDTAAEVRFRDAAVAAGLCAPSSVPLVEGGHVLRLPAALGGLRYRAYSWADGTTVADSVARGQAAEWLGTTLGRLHRLRLAPVAAPDLWFEKVPGPAERRSLLLAAARAGASWPGGPATALDRMAELAPIVTPAAPPSLILCHLDVKPDNVLRNAQGGYSLIDWDDFGAGAPDRELASVLMRWYAEGGDLDSDAVSRVLSCYRETGGTVEFEWSSFAMLCATSINYVHAQVTIVADQEQPDEARTFAADELRTAVRLLPDPAVLRKVLNLGLLPG